MATRAEHQPIQHGGINKKVAAGILAGAIGVAAFGGYELTQNKGGSTTPESTPPAGGGIVELSNSPIPTQVKPSESIVIPSASPSATPEATPTPEPTPVAKEDFIKQAKEQGAKIKSMTTLKTELNNLYENNPQLNNIADKTFSLTALRDCNSGNPADASNKNLVLSDRYAGCFYLASKFYRDVYKPTLNQDALQFALDIAQKGIVELPDFEKYLEQGIL